MVGRLNSLRLALSGAVLLCVAAPAQAIPVALIAAIAPTLSTLAATIIAVVLNIGLSLLAGALFGPKNPKAPSQVTTVQLGEAPRQVLFGRVATAGSLVDAFDTGGKHDTAWEVVIYAIADHKCHGLVGVFVNDDFHAITSDGGVGFVGSGGIDALQLWWRDGSPGQTIPSAITPGSDKPYEGNSGPFGADAFSDADFTGIAYVVMAYQADKAGEEQPEFPGGRPRFLFVVDGKRCYDPRKDSTEGGSGSHRWNDPDSWEWTDNPIVCRYNYERGIYALDQVDQPEMLLVGRGLSADEAPPENVAAYANICDEEIFLASGETEKRYTVSAAISSTETFIDVEEKFAACVAGVIIQPSGSVEVEPGVAKVAAVAITDDDLVVGEPVRFSNFRSDSDSDWVNSVIARYPEPSQKYQDHSAPIRRNYDDVIADGGAREQQLSLEYVVSGTQAQRCAEIERRKGRLARMAAITLGPRFAAIEEGDWIDWTSDRYTNGEVVEFRVESYNLGAPWRNTLELREIASNVFDWDTSDEVDDGSIAGVPTTPPPPLEAPESADWSATGTMIVGDGGSMPALVITGAVPQDTVEVIDKIIFEYRLYVFGQDDDAGWGGASQEPVTTTRKEILGIAPDSDYDVSVRYAVRGYVGARLIIPLVTAGSIKVPIPTMPKPPDVTVELNSAGTAPLSGEYPVEVQFTRQAGSYDVTATTSFSIVSTTGTISASINDTLGDPERGLLTVTSGLGKVTVKTSRSGEQDLTQTIELKGHAAGTAGPGATYDVDVTPGDVTSTSDNITTETLAVTATDTTITCSASLGYRCGASGNNLNSTVKGKFIRSTSSDMSSPSDVGSFVMGSPEVAPGPPIGKDPGTSGTDGMLTVSQNDTGRTIGVTYYYQFVEQAVPTPDAYPIHQWGVIRVDA